MHPFGPTSLALQITAETRRGTQFKRLCRLPLCCSDGVFEGSKYLVMWGAGSDEQFGLRMDVLAPSAAEVVEHGHVVPPLDQRVDDVAPDEAGPSGDDDSHVATLAGPNPADQPRVPPRKRALRSGG